MNQSKIDRNFTCSWKIDYKTISMLAFAPFLIVSFIDRSNFVLNLCLYVVFILTFRPQFHWLELTEKSLRYIKTKDNILNYEYDESFAFRLNSKEFCFEEIQELKMIYWGSAIELKLIDGTTIRIELLSKSKAFKNEILNNLKMHLARKTCTES